MTYRLDSDIHWLYGWVEEINTGMRKEGNWGNFPQLTKEQVNKYTFPKQKLVAWAVSSCKTQSRW